LVARRPPADAVIIMPDGTKYDVSGNNFGKGQGSIL
jgi:hypothetical protein